MQKLEIILKNIGHSESECILLSTLITRGDSTVQYLSKQTGLARQTIYSILERLELLGLISSSNRSGTKRFSCTADSLQTYLEEKSRQYANAEKGVGDIAAEIEQLLQKHEPRLPQAKYFTGELGLSYLFTTILKDLSEAKSRKHFKGFGVNSYSETGIQKTIETFAKKRSKLGVHTELILADKEADFYHGQNEDNLKRTVKKIDIPESKAGCYLIDDKVYLFSFQDRVGIRIEHKAIAELLTNVFNYIWKDEKSI